MADLITFKCVKCQHVLKIGADKAGRKSKCPKCGESQTIPTPKATAQELLDQEEEAGQGAYGFADEPASTAAKVDLSKPTRREDEKAGGQKGQKRDKAVKHRTLLEPELWQPVKLGLQIVGIGYCVWILVFVLHLIPFVIASCTTVFPPLFGSPLSQSHSDYATLALRYTTTMDAVAKKTDQELGPNYLGKSAFAVGVIAGNDMLEVSLWLFRIAEVFMLITIIIMMVGYFIALPVPERFGTKGLLIALLSVGGANLLFRGIFRLLPLTGVMDFTLLMYVTPELAMTDSNIERVTPLHEHWSHAPFWECFFALLLQLLSITEPVLFAAFLRAVALSMKSDKLEGTTRSMLQVATAQGFFQLAYFLLANTGTSDVLIIVLRTVYTLAQCFFLGQLIWFIVVIYRIPPLIDKELEGG